LREVPKKVRGQTLLQASSSPPQRVCLEDQHQSLRDWRSVKLDGLLGVNQAPEGSAYKLVHHSTSINELTCMSGALPAPGNGREL